VGRWSGGLITVATRQERFDEVGASGGDALQDTHQQAKRQEGSIPSPRTKFKEK